jgi:DNA-binding NtrC family response regulator
MIDPSAPPLRILLVVDNEPTVGTVAIPLTEVGHALAIVQTAREVFAQIEKQPWDALIIDLSPVEAALDLVRQVYQRKPDLSIILLTDQPSAMVMEDGFAGGAYDWLFKPALFPMVISALHRARERRTLRQEVHSEHTGLDDLLKNRHEINNQLAGVIGLVQLHLTDQGLAPELRQDLTLVLNHAKRLRELLGHKPRF